MKIALLLLPIIFLGCAGKNTTTGPVVGKAVDSPQSISCPNDKAGPTAQAVMAGRLDILTSAGLTEEQKMQFMSLMNDTHLKVAKIKQKEGEIKSTLFRSLAEGIYNQKLAESSKLELRKLEKEKMRIMFSSLDKARSILGTSIRLDPDIFRGYHDGVLF